MSNAAYKVLGPLQVTGPDGRDVSLSGKQRAVLATLLLHVNTLVGKQRLVAALWETPPSSAVSNLQTYITQLRRVLPPGPRLLTKGAGYVFEAGPGEVDLLTFDQAVRLARTEHGWNAVQHYERALSQWRGRPAEGTELAGSALARITELEARHAAVRLDWAEAKLDLGQSAEVIEDLRAFVAEQPFSERAWRSLMLALSQTGQRDAALEAYQQVRHVLVDELGIEPSKQLQRLHVEILADTVPAGTSDARRPICQLPPSMADFVGRVEELAQVHAILHPTADRTTPAIAVLTGPPGIGKTTLAVQVAHELRDEFPDGQLYLSLRNDSPDALLADMLRCLQRPGSDIPDATEGKGALYRSLLADRAVLVVLDDAEQEEQVRCLLPGTSRGAVLVTSRGPLPTLADAIRVPVGLPSETEARALLARIAGESRVHAEPDAARTIVLACGRLPLAIRVAGARLVTRPAWPLRELATRLTAGPPLDELAVGELNVRTTFAVSYQLLPDLPRRTFRLIGMTGMDSITEWIVAALLGESARDADVSLEALMVAGLLHAGGVDHGGQPRYRMHELLRSFSSERAHAEDAPEQRELATRRLVAESLKRVRRTGMDCQLPAERFLTIARAAGPEAAARLTLADMDLDRGLLPSARSAFQTVFNQESNMASAVYAVTGMLACDLLEGRLAPIDVGEALAYVKATDGINDLLANLLDVCGGQSHDQRELVYVLRQALLRSGDQRFGEPTTRFLRALVAGIICHRERDLSQAAGHYQECVDMSRALSWGAGERYALRRLGEALRP